MPTIKEMEDAILLADSENRQDDVAFIKEMLIEAIEAEANANVKPNTGQGSFIDPVTQGITAGLSDEIKGVGALFGNFYNQLKGTDLKPSGITGEVYSPYEAVRDESRKDLESFTERNPKTSLALEATGGLIFGGTGATRTLGTKAFREADKLQQMLKVAKVAGSESAIYGFGKGEGQEDSIRGALEEGVKGTILGPAIQQTMKKALPLFREIKGKAKKIQETMMPTTNLDDLKLQSKAAYKKLDDANIRVRSGPYKKFARMVLNDIHAVGISGRSRKTMTAAMNELAELKNPTFTDLFKLRKLLTTSRSNFNDPGILKAANKMTKQIDEFMASLTEKQVSKGNISNVRNLLSEAKDTWHRQAQVTTLEDLRKRAMRSEANISGDADLAIRSKLRSIMDSERKSLPFDDDALAAMDNIIIGTPKKNIYRRAGEMAPGSRTARGEGPTLAAAAFGAMKTGKAEIMLIGAMLPTIIGGIFKGLANKGTKKELQILMDSIVNKNQLDLEKIIDTLARRQDSKLGMSAAAFSTAILANLDATPGGYQPDKEFTSLGDMISP